MLLLWSLVCLIAFMSLLWAVSLAMRDASIIDPFWGLGFVLVAGLSAGLSAAPTTRQWLLVALTMLWGLRLSFYLFARRRGEGEDRRYAAMRQRHGARFWWVSLFTVFWLQAGILWFVSLPLQVAALRGLDAPLGWLDACGVALWLVGFVFESVGDWQLARFKRAPENRGRVLDRGLWRFTRHPNYFGDFCVWWGLYLVAAAGGAALTILSPLLMSVLLMRFSGVGLLERTIADRRPEYADYQARTNAFFPGPPRSRPA
jgi:steroid 5-alpha reductase family enzyme